jgi:hypothetical protein
VEDSQPATSLSRSSEMFMPDFRTLRVMPAVQTAFLQFEELGAFSTASAISFVEIRRRDKSGFDMDDMASPPSSESVASVSSTMHPDTLAIMPYHIRKK